MSMDRSIAIELHGSVSCGLWSPERGESRWAQNIAAVLGAAGYPVLGFGSWQPGDGAPWGECPRIPNVEIVVWQALREREPAALFDAAHWHEKPIVGRPRTVLRGYFSVESQIMASTWPANHRLVYPYTHNLPTLGSVPNHEARRLQIPILPLAWWEQFSPVPFDWPTRRGLVVGTKPPHNPESDAGRWWTAMLWAARDIGEPAAFVAGVHYPEAWRRQAESVPGSRLFGFVPLGAAQRLMRGATVCLNPPYSGLFPLECVMEGCIPTVWRGDYIPTLEAATERIDSSLLLDIRNPDATAMRRVLDRLLTDEPLRNLLLEAYREALRPYMADAALETWREVERWIA